MENVHCSSIQYMVIESANYGDFNQKGVFSDVQNIDRECSALTSCQVKSHCGGRTSCALRMDNDLLTLTYCSDNSKEIYTKYTCKDSYDSTALTTGKVLGQNSVSCIKHSCQIKFPSLSLSRLIAAICASTKVRNRL